MAAAAGAILLLGSLLWLEGCSQDASGEQRVTTLPGYDGELPFELYTGYITVNETTSNNLFYYFIKSERNATEDPLILWLTGGPGCSGLSAIAFEIGPMRFKWEEYTAGVPPLMYHPYGYTRIASIIFVDSPTFTGYSYSNSTSDYLTSNSANTEEDYVFLKKWLEMHPEFQSNPLYIAGDSYAGMIIPAVTYKVVQDIENGTGDVFNLKGYFAGNPTTDDYFDASQIPQARGMALIPEELYEVTKESCHGQYYSPPNENCTSNLELVDELIKQINEQNILEVYCGFYWSPKRRPRVVSRRAHYEFESVHDYSYLIPPIDCRAYTYYLSYIWANNETVKEALHVRNGTVNEWQRCSSTITFNKEWTSVIEYHRALLTKGYLALFYRSLSLSLCMYLSLVCGARGAYHLSLVRFPLFVFGVDSYRLNGGAQVFWAAPFFLSRCL
ncbi:unnamed protein product [Victoria cruziana]